MTLENPSPVPPDALPGAAADDAPAAPAPGPSGAESPAPTEPLAPLRYPRPLIFLHIPKAAGTTLQDYLLRHYFPGGKCFRFTGEDSRLAEFLALPQSERDRYDVLAGHVHFGVHTALSQPATYLTMLRDPVERLISAYYFIHAHPEHYLHSYVVGRGLTIHEYAAMGVNQENDNDHVRWLTSHLHTDVPFGQVTRAMLEEAKWNLEHAVTVFGLAERFTDSLRCIAAAFGWPDVPHTKRLNSNPRKLTRAQLAPETIDAFRESNRYDLELYEFAQSLFDAQLLRLGVRPLKAGPA